MSADHERRVFLQLASPEFQKMVDERVVARGLTCSGYEMVQSCVPDCRIMADEQLGLAGAGTHGCAL